jgi:endonuclease/exonuclease/phosphatase family metal-dependent hydrolase
MIEQTQKLVLAIHFNSRGFAFVLFEGSTNPIDWGIVDARGVDKDITIRERLKDLFARYQPDFLVLQDMSYMGTHRPHRIRRLNRLASALAEEYAFAVTYFAREAVRRCFRYLTTVTKDTIAAAVAKRLPAFERLIPPRRKTWNSEDARMGVFDAAALALTFFSAEGDLPE